MATLPCAYAESIPTPVEVSFQDTAHHNHWPGHAFTIDLSLKSERKENILFHWVDYRGEPTTQPAVIATNSTTSLRSPSTHIGYYGLILKPATSNITLPNRLPGEAREYGFTILPPAPRKIADASTQLGLVQAKLSDPYLPGWIKSLTWKTRRPKWWQAEMQKRAEAGVIELPIILGPAWETDDAKPISDAALSLLEKTASQYFLAYKKTLVWETGIEENLKSRYKQRWYWQNLARKIKRLRQLADRINPNIKFTYQIAGLKQKYVRAFINSEASRYYDILALHPYAWPDFPPPESWLPDYLTEVRATQNNAGLRQAIWLTEVGAPHRGNTLGAFFGYPRKHRQVPGQTRYGALVYMLKMHIVALSNSVEKVFWYNYQDRAPEREQAENHFGLRDFWGYPKPVYAGYATLQRLIKGKTSLPLRTTQIRGQALQIYPFTGDESDTYVIWAPKSEIGLKVEISAITGSTHVGNTVTIINPAGTPTQASGHMIYVSSEPLYLVVQH